MRAGRHILWGCLECWLLHDAQLMALVFDCFGLFGTIPHGYHQPSYNESYWWIRCGYGRVNQHSSHVDDQLVSTGNLLLMYYGPQGQRQLPPTEHVPFVLLHACIGFYSHSSHSSPLKLVDGIGHTHLMHGDSWTPGVQQPPQQRPSGNKSNMQKVTLDMHNYMQYHTYSNWREVPTWSS